MNIPKRFVYQILNCTCAKCGGNVKIDNSKESDVFSLSVDGVLYFNCPKCKESYDIPFVNYSR